jgi:hypothetical protein
MAVHLKTFFSITITSISFPRRSGELSKIRLRSVRIWVIVNKWSRLLMVKYLQLLKQSAFQRMEGFGRVQRHLQKLDFLEQTFNHCVED